jgi:hypothetical protein
LKRGIRAAVFAAASAAAVVGASGAAFGAVTIAPNSGVTDGQFVTVTWSGYNPNEIVFINQCRKAQDDPTFNFINDCSQGTGANPSSDASGAGSAQFQIFVGSEPVNGDWACGVDTVGGSVVSNVCYVRTAPGAIAGTSRDETASFTMDVGGGTTTTTEASTTTTTIPGTDVPEAPYAALLPLGAVALIGGGYIIRRSRKAAN